MSKSNNWFVRGFKDCVEANQELFFLFKVFLVLGGIFVLAKFFPLAMFIALCLFVAGLYLALVGGLIYLMFISYFIDAYREVKMERLEKAKESAISNNEEK